MRAACVVSAPFLHCAPVISGRVRHVQIGGTNGHRLARQNMAERPTWTGCMAPGVIMTSSTTANSRRRTGSVPEAGDVRRSDESREAVPGRPDGVEPRSPRDPLGRVKLLLRATISILHRFIQLVIPERVRRFFALRNLQRLSVLFMIAYYTLGILVNTLGRRVTTQSVLYSDFLHFAERGAIQTVLFEGDKITFWVPTRVSLEAPTLEGGDILAFPLGEDSTGQAKTPRVAAASDDEPKALLRCETTPVAGHDPVPFLLSSGVRFGTAERTYGGVMQRVATQLLTTFLPFLPTLWLLHLAVSGRSGSGKKKATGRRAPLSSTTFDSLAGVDAAVQELKECVACLKDSERYAAIGARLPSGVLLHGPPGTGKTLLARAVAGEAGVPFFVVSASEFVELYVGRGAQRVRELFAQAREATPCVVFIDELDAVGQKRGYGQHEEREQTLDQLLTELDGFEGRPGVLLLAATNRMESLDSALLRPGRLSRKILVALPDEQGRAGILKVHLRGMEVVGGDEGLRYICQVVARLTPGMSGADLMNIVNEAAFVAVRNGVDVLGLPEFLEAVSRTRDGVRAGGASRMQRFGSTLAGGLQWLTGTHTHQARELPQAGTLTGGDE